MGVKCTNCGTEHADWIPKDRLDTVAKQRRDLETKLNETETEPKTVRDEFEGKAKDLKQLGELQSQVESYKAKEAAWGLERSIVRAGITDDEGVEFTSLAWQRIPEDKRPEGGITAWLADREALPRAVQIYMPDEAPAGASQGAQGSQQGQGAAEGAQGTQATSQGAQGAQQGQGTGQAAQGAQQGQGQPHPRSTQGMDPNASGPAPAQFSADQIRAMSNEEYLRHREAINAQQRKA